MLHISCYYKWYCKDKNIYVLTTQSTYTNSVSGTDGDGFDYYDTVYNVVGEVTIDDSGRFVHNKYDYVDLNSFNVDYYVAYNHGYTKMDIVISMQIKEIDKANLTKKLFDDVMFFQIAEGGAMGEAGGVVFINEKEYEMCNYRSR